MCGGCRKKEEGGEEREKTVKYGQKKADRSWKRVGF
jgi:hypothetical protein